MSIRRAARAALKAAIALAVALAVRVLLGVWAAAALVAVALVVGLVAGWAAVEARALDRRPRPALQTVVRHRPSGDHVEFARALTAVAAAYLAECERQESHP